MLFFYFGELNYKSRFRSIMTLLQALQRQARAAEEVISGSLPNGTALLLRKTREGIMARSGVQNTPSRDWMKPSVISF